MANEQEIPQGSLMLQGAIAGFTTKKGGPGSHIRVLVDIPHEKGVTAALIDNMSGKNINVKINGPFLVAKDTEDPDQTHFGDPKRGED